MGVTLQQLNKSKFTGPLASNFGLKTRSRKIDQIQNTRKHKRDQMGWVTGSTSSRDLQAYKPQRNYSVSQLII